MSTKACRGVSLIELLVFIVVVGVAMAGIFAVFNVLTAASADPQVRKQALAIAESLMDEVQLMPFTFCDPDDANAATAQNSIVGDPQGCATTSEDTAMGPEGETRYLAPRFDNVSDYHGFSMSGIRNLADNAVSGLEGYSASISVSQAGMASGADAIAAAEALRISVTVTPPSGSAVTLEGYRTRYAPNSLP